MRTTALTLMTAALVTLALSAPAGAEEHTVKSGETLSKIARKHGCPLRVLKRNNRLKGDMIRVGQKLTIPEDCGAAAAAAPGAVVTHTVIPGDTLGGIAARYGVTVGHLEGMNRALGKKKVILRIGQKIRLKTTKRIAAPRKVIHRISAGETLSRIAARYKLRAGDIARMNPRKDPNKLQIGDRITLWLEGPESKSAAVGRPQAGKLIDGEQLPRGTGWYRRRPHNAWGTNETIKALTESFAAVRRKHPKAHDIAVGDVSSKKGGRLRGHKSHQNGRDADIGFYFKGQKRAGPKAFLSANRHKLDYEATWTLLMELIGDTPRKSRVEYLFVDYGVQKKLYTWAKEKKNVSDKLLRRIFQYPRGRRAMRGIVRHEPGHANHIHVRFRCPQGDDACT